jgi:hypothetical protein
MQFECKFLKLNDLQEEDPCLTYGYFKIRNLDTSIHFFESKNCILFLTLNNLLEFVTLIDLKKSWKFRWVGEGNGSQIYFKHKDNKIELKSDGFTIVIDLIEFVDSLKFDMMKFMNKCIEINQEIVRDPIFNYTQELLQKLSLIILK